MKTAAEHAAKKKAAGKVAVLKSLVVIDVKPCKKNKQKER